MIKKYEKFKQGKYIRMAFVDFYFLKNVKRKIFRKYRYHKFYGKWERYENKYQSYIEPPILDK